MDSASPPRANRNTSGRFIKVACGTDDELQYSNLA